MNSGSYFTELFVVVFGITTLVGRGGSFFITGLTCGLIDTSDFGSTCPFFIAGFGATGASFTGALTAGLLTGFTGVFAAGLEAGFAVFLATGFEAAFLGNAFLGAGFFAAGRAAFLSAGFFAAAFLAGLATFFTGFFLLALFAILPLF